MDEVIDPAAGSLLRSKLMPPQASAEYLHRPQLEEALSTNEHARVLLLAAPAGFGKTSALAALARARTDAGYAVAWLSLGPGDDEPARFLLQLIDALTPLVPGLGAEAQAYLQNTMGVPVSAVMESLLVDLAQLERPLLLVLDDLHLIQDAELIAALNRLIKFAPACFSLAIGSRSQPPLSLATL
ncbi:MAG TPA: AAA family ATPase, partial [Pseudomonas sp.]|nr:AAA family ATPase [Pseudomonas sp.]